MQGSLHGPCRPRGRLAQAQGVVPGQGDGRQQRGREQPRQRRVVGDAVAHPGAQPLVDKTSTGQQHGLPGCQFGGRFVPETLVPACQQLEAGFREAWGDPVWRDELATVLREYAGRPSIITECHNLSERLGLRLLLKREDLNHTGAHKINNVIGQALLAKRMGKTRLVAETGAGQHGVASATAAALLGMECKVYMGAVDVERQALNVFRMRLLGAEVEAVHSGSKTLKDAVNEAMRDWVATVEHTHYCLGSVMGPHPYPFMVRQFHRVIGEEAAVQLEKQTGRAWPDLAIACVGGGSNALGLFTAFLGRREVRLVGVEAGGTGEALGDHAARFRGGRLLAIQPDFGEFGFPGNGRQTMTQQIM